MMVYFLRHAEAEDSAVEDFHRRLTPKGVAQAEKVGRFLARTGLVPDVILSSPVVRAIQTARAVAALLDGDLVEERWLACGMTPEDFLREIRPWTDRAAVLLVGHEPDISETVAALVGTTRSDAVKIRKASVTGVALPVVEFGAGQLQFLVPARLMPRDDA